MVVSCGGRCHGSVLCRSFCHGSVLRGKMRIGRPSRITSSRGGVPTTAKCTPHTLRGGVPRVLCEVCPPYTPQYCGERSVSRVLYGVHPAARAIAGCTPSHLLRTPAIRGITSSRITSGAETWASLKTASTKEILHNSLVADYRSLWLVPLCTPGRR